MDPPSVRIPSSQGLDVLGAITVTAALMLAVYAVVKGNDVGWLTLRTDGILAASASLILILLGIKLGMLLSQSHSAPQASAPVRVARGVSTVRQCAEHRADQSADWRARR